MFEGKDITIQTNVLEVTPKGAILEIIFRGVHDHHWPDGKRIQEFVDKEIQNVNPAAIVLNFKEYHYEWGNEIGGPIMSAGLHKKNNRFRPFAVVAEGMTARRLKSLMKDGMLDRVFTFEFCEDTEAARFFLRRVIGVTNSK